MFARGIVAAMEDETQTTELAIDEAGADSMEADLVETVDLAADIDSGTSEIAQTVKDADQLERHVEVLTEAEGEGGASPELVEATEIAVEGIYERLGIHSGTGIPALESFTTKQGKARNTRVAIEEISGKIKQIWEAVKMAFKKLINYVKDFFAKLFDANAKMLGRVNSLRSKVSAIKGEASGKIPGSGVSNVIGVTNAADAKKGLSVSIGAAVKLAQADVESLGSFVAGVSDKAAFDSVGWDTGGGTVVAGAAAPEGFNWNSGFQVGANHVAYLVPKASVKGEAAYGAAAKYQVKVLKGDKAEAGELEVLSQADMTALLTAVEGRVKELMNNKSAIAQIQGKLEAAIADINKAVSQAPKEEEGASDRSTKARSAVTSLANGSIKLVTMSGSELTRGLQAVLTYVERSVGAYKEAPAAADPKEGAAKK